MPDTHEILFCRGGASLQFSMIPLIDRRGRHGRLRGDRILRALPQRKRKKYCRVHIAGTSESTALTRVPAQRGFLSSPEAKYFYYCAE